jgi:hypothetical protein
MFCIKISKTAAAVNLSVAQCKARERSEDEPQFWGNITRHRATEVAPLFSTIERYE